MNITSKIAEENSGELENIFWPTLKYSFMRTVPRMSTNGKIQDSKKPLVFDNKSGNSRKEVITIFKKHIINKQNGLHKISTRIK
jgi:hypothetical protein